MKKVKSVLVKIGKKAIILLLPIIIIVVLISSFVYFITIDDGTYKDKDWTSTPYGASQYTSNIKVNTDGTMGSSMPAQELWDKMIESGSRANLYLDGPEDLLKLMNAETITQFPDTRDDPTKEIDWDSVNNINESILQGIIKFKRKDQDENETLMTYVEPYLFDGWIEDYNSTGDKETKKNLLNHFTIRENVASTDDSSGKSNVVVTGKVADVTKAIVDEITKRSNYGLGKSQCQAWVGKAYAAAGLGYYPSGCCAYLAGKKWGVSKDFSKIVSGAAVWTGEGTYKYTKCSVHTNGGCGHAGIYYEDNGVGYVMHLINGKVLKTELNEWISTYGAGNTPVWGWQGGIKVVEEGDNSSASETENSETSNDEINIEKASTSSYYAEVATWNEVTETIETDDSQVDTTPSYTYNMTTKQINYQDLVSDYVMPFDYLWSMLVVTEDKDFVMDLVDLVYNSKIEITVYDNVATNTNVEVNKYTRKKNVFTNASVYVKYYKDENDSNLKTKNASGTNWDYDVTTGDDVGNYTTVHTTVTKTNTVNIAVTYADVWMAKYQQTFSNQKSSTDSPGSPETLEDIGYKDKYDKRVEGNQNSIYANKLINETKNKIDSSAIIDSTGINSVIEEIYYATVNRTKTVSNTLETNTYVASQMSVEEKTDKESEKPNFVTILLDRDNLKAKNNILNVKSWLFELLETNDSTKDLLDLTKYLLYKATGIDLGVTEFDFGVYGLKSVSGASGGLGLLNITSTTLTREEFVSAVQSYSAAISKGNGTKVFRDNAGVIYDICVKNNINPVLCAAQAWQEQNWDDPNTSPFNFWGIAVYNGQNYGNKYASMENALEGYCRQINNQISGSLKSTYQSTAAKFATVNSKFKGDMSTIYDIFSAYAYIGKGHTVQEEADYAANYVESIMKCASQIFGEGALEAVSYGSSTEYANASATEKVKNLFPNGIPQNEAELMPYLTIINVPATSKSGNKYTISVQVHKAIAQDVYNACLAAQQEGFKIYEIGGYGSWRWNDNAGKAGGLPHSQHCYGLAVDINSTENGQFKNGKPTSNWFYSPGSNPYSIKPDSSLVKTFKAAGWGWGGDWTSSKDYMHFSFCGT